MNHVGHFAVRWNTFCLWHVKATKWSTTILLILGIISKSTLSCFPNIILILRIFVWHFHGNILSTKLIKAYMINIYHSHCMLKGEKQRQYLNDKRKFNHNDKHPRHNQCWIDDNYKIYSTLSINSNLEGINKYKKSLTPKMSFKILHDRGVAQL